jgi:hypothetical protein
MPVTVEDLQNEDRYSLIEELSIDDIVQFVFRQIRLLNPSTFLFFAGLIISFIFMVRMLFLGVLSGDLDFSNIILNSLLGFVCWPVLLIPIHELVHALMYKIMGAPALKFGWKPDKFLFYVSADKYVIGKTGFLLVAYSPFILISLVLILLIHLTDYPISWSFAACLFAHTTMCIGDFALAGFFMQHPDNNIYTYDDVENGITYFYVHKSDR